MKVCKFGGTSVASAEKIRQVLEIVKSDSKRRVVVVSAPGKRNAGDIKVTDLLIRMAERHLAEGQAEDELREVVARYREIGEGLGLPNRIIQQIESDLRRRLATDASHRSRFVDRLKAAGEDNCARLVAAYFNQAGLAAQYVSPATAGLVVSEEYGKARVMPESYRRLASLRQRRRVVVFPGFFGLSRDGDIVTFSRGGSDITGAILAAAVKAEVYENFTDVDSVFAASPHFVDNPVSIPSLTYREMRELAYAGFAIFHDEALEPVLRAGVPVCVKNTNNPKASGTWIVPERQEAPGTVVGIAGDSGFCSIYVSKYLMNREIGFGRRLLQILEENGLSYEHMPSGIDNVSVILREAQFDSEVEGRVIARIRRELEADAVEVERNLALVMIVGEGMQHTPGIASRATTALARAGINIEMINQGSSEVSMMFGVKAKDLRGAVRALYEEFFGNIKCTRGFRSNRAS